MGKGRGASSTVWGVREGIAEGLVFEYLSWGSGEFKVCKRERAERAEGIAKAWRYRWAGGFRGW